LFAFVDVPASSVWSLLHNSKLPIIHSAANTAPSTCHSPNREKIDASRRRMKTITEFHSSGYTIESESDKTVTTTLRLKNPLVGGPH
jgi:hypothetical protein